MAPDTSLRTASIIWSEGLVCPPMEPTSALMADIVTLMSNSLAWLASHGGFETRPYGYGC